MCPQKCWFFFKNISWNFFFIAVTDNMIVFTIHATICNSLQEYLFRSSSSIVELLFKLNRNSPLTHGITSIANYNLNTFKQWFSFFSNILNFSNISKTFFLNFLTKIGQELNSIFWKDQNLQSYHVNWKMQFDFFHLS